MSKDVVTYKKHKKGIFNNTEASITIEPELYETPHKNDIEIPTFCEGMSIVKNDTDLADYLENRYITSNDKKTLINVITNDCDTTTISPDNKEAIINLITSANLQEITGAPPEAPSEAPAKPKEAILGASSGGKRKSKHRKSKRGGSKKSKRRRSQKKR